MLYHGAICGRFASYGPDRHSTTEEALACRLPTDLLTDRYSITPGQQLLMIRPAKANGNKVAEVKWS